MFYNYDIVSQKVIFSWYLFYLDGAQSVWAAEATLKFLKI